MVEVMKIMAASFRRPHAGTVRSVPPALQQDIVDPGLRRRLLDTRAQVWLSLLRGLCSFLLGPGAQVSVCVLQVCFPVLCKFWQL